MGLYPIRLRHPGDPERRPAINRNPARERGSGSGGERPERRPERAGTRGTGAEHPDSGQHLGRVRIVLDERRSCVAQRKRQHGAHACSPVGLGQRNAYAGRTGRARTRNRPAQRGLGQRLGPGRPVRAGQLERTRQGSASVRRQHGCGRAHDGGTGRLDAQRHR